MKKNFHSEPWFEGLLASRQPPAPDTQHLDTMNLCLFIKDTVGHRILRWKVLLRHIIAVTPKTSAMPMLHPSVETSPNRNR